jgi:hypothetical protein
VVVRKVTGPVSRLWIRRLYAATP